MQDEIEKYPNIQENQCDFLIEELGMFIPLKFSVFQNDKQGLNMWDV